MLSKCQVSEHPDVTRIGHGLKEAGEHQLVSRGTGSVLAGNLSSAALGPESAERSGRVTGTLSLIRPVSGSGDPGPHRGQSWPALDNIGDWRQAYPANLFNQ